MQNKLSDPKFAVVVSYLVEAYAASRHHNFLASACLLRCGDGNGQDISGVVRDHFPKPEKDALRALAQTVTVSLDKAFAARPKGVRFQTILRLKEAVISRDGKGFYG